MLSKFYLLMKQQKKSASFSVMCELAYFCKLRRILDEFVKLQPTFTSQSFVFNHGHGRKSCFAYIRRSERDNLPQRFFVKAGYSSFNEIQKFVGCPELNFLFR